MLHWQILLAITYQNSSVGRMLVDNQNKTIVKTGSVPSDIFEKVRVGKRIFDIWTLFVIIW